MRKIAILIFGAFLTIQVYSQNTQNTIKVEEGDTKEAIINKAAHVVPTENQLDALRNEFIAFIHFGPNTYTRMEWGSGMEDPEVFDLKTLDTDQWCRAMKDAGMKMVILTVKHHDGFVLWQSRYTNHGIMSTPFRDGKGDILKDLSESCRKYGLKLGVYLSPADLYQIENPEGLYGNLSEYTKRTIPREVEGRPFKNKTQFEFVVDDYNEYFLNQLFEILTEYGEIHEVWFDGAHPKRKGGQTYNYTAWRELIRTLAPKAVIFGREDIRWCGNEAGATRDTEWNVVTYEENPGTATEFHDMTDRDLGSREVLYKANYLHYQPAETNTSIREGWFYRDDTNQKVRSADDVFDIYERSVGGNSIFLLNIPPNREGKFSPRDVEVLEEVGNRIHQTYGNNLFDGATGPKEVLDDNPDTYILLDKGEIVITLPAQKTFNRLMLQEAIATHSERVEKHAVDAWVDNEWKEIATATNIGYKCILRFPEVTTDRIRIRVLESRLTPAISHISAHYYNTRPPQLAFTRDKEGLVTIAPLQTEFNWNPTGDNAADNINAGYEIFYTLDGSEPTQSSMKYESPIKVEHNILKAVSYINNVRGAVKSEEFGLVKKDWKLLGVSSETDRRAALNAFDAVNRTYWQSGESDENHYIALDLGALYNLKAFVYTPQTFHPNGMISRGEIQISENGENWKTADTFEFGNLINDPTPRTHYFATPFSTRYIRLVATGTAGDEKYVTVSELDFLTQTQEGFVHERSSEYVWPEEKEVLEQLDEWQDLKFGVLFHWGLYSVPGIVESWSICSEDVDWIPRDSTMNYVEYKRWYWGLKDKFNPVDFDPDQWSSIMERAGMKYAIFTTKHHDGFNMFDTKQTDFSIANGPFKDHPKADVAKYVFDSFRKKDFMVGAYFSKPDWHSQYYWWDYFATPNRNVNYKIERHPERWENFKNFTYNQLEELMSGYGEIDILWLDGGWVAPSRQDIDMDKIAGMARKYQNDLIIVDRTIRGKYENYQTPERSIPMEQLPYPWESCIPLSSDWGWIPDAKFKTPAEVIAMLIEVTAKGGNMLLGVGPTPEGIIQPEVEEILNDIGDWLEINGKGIYNTRITPNYNSGNVWFTADKDNQTIYAHYIPEKGKDMPSVIEWEGSMPVKGSNVVSLLTNKRVKWKVEGDKTIIELPKTGGSENLPLVFSFKTVK